MAQAAGLPWAVALEAPGGPVNAAAARGGEGDHSLAGQGVALQEGVHDAGLHIPPDGKAQEHGVVLVHVFHRGGDGRTAGGVVHLDGAAALFVGPVQVGSGVGDGGADLIQVAPHGLGDGFGSPGGGAAGGEIGHKDTV